MTQNDADLLIDAAPNCERLTQAVWIDHADCDVRVAKGNGECALPRIRPGDLVIIDLKNAPNPGELCIVYVGGKPIVKRFLGRDEKGVRAFNENPPMVVWYAEPEALWRIIAVKPAEATPEGQG